MMALITSGTPKRLFESSRFKVQGEINKLGGSSGFETSTECATAAVTCAGFRGPVRDERWSEAIGVRSLTFVDKVKSELGFKAVQRDEHLQMVLRYVLQNPVTSGLAASVND